MAVSLRWYVVNVYAGFEKRISEQIREKVAEKGLGEQLGEILVPSEEVTEISRGAKVTREKQYFPGYILVEMHLNNEIWYVIRSIPRVGGILGAQGTPAPISACEVERIRQSMVNKTLSEHQGSLYQIGEMVRVTDGPFASFQGVVEEISQDKSKLKVSISIFGRYTNIDLTFSQVSKT
ncbi:MAG: transcription termination/antitermination protein NusG [Holosporales bacterium]|jgi:transcriptional antiterminator NusG|nr:transcription termination/antitermination protein NusG [Holosporales bacterium]